MTLKPVVRWVLDNGLTVLVQPLPHSASVSAGVTVLTGSRDEAPAEAGLSHLVEHMLFQGTNQRDMRELSRVISAVGGHLDAFTGRESTAYYAKVPSRHLALALDVLGDIIGQSRLQASHLAKEKKVILEEIRMYEDTPDELVHDLFAQALWPRHPLGRSILGTHRRLENVARTQLAQFVRRHYHPERMLLAVAGGVDLAEVKRLANRYFGRLACKGERAQDGPAVPATQLARPVHKFRRLEQVHLCLGVRGLPFADARRLEAMALSNILGGATNSRLFYQVRERRALAYSIYSFLDFYRDTGMLGVYVACHPRHLRETLTLVRAECQRLALTLISDREWQDVREQMQGNLLLSCESSSSHMWNMIQNETYLHAHPSLPSVLAAIQKISQEDIRQVARDFFIGQPWALAVVGPVKNFTPLTNLA